MQFGENLHKTLICHTQFTWRYLKQSRFHFSPAKWKKACLELSEVYDLAPLSVFCRCTPPFVSSHFHVSPTIYLPPCSVVWLLLNPQAIGVVRYGMGSYFQPTPSVYRALVFLKADKMKGTPHPLLCILLDSSFSHSLHPLILPCIFFNFNYFLDFSVSLAHSLPSFC